MKHKNFKYVIPTQYIMKFMFSTYLFTLQYDYIYNDSNAKLITLIVKGFRF
jgi:hypothetical protein